MEETTAVNFNFPVKNLKISIPLILVLKFVCCVLSFEQSKCPQGHMNWHTITITDYP